MQNSINAKLERLDSMNYIGAMCLITMLHESKNEAVREELERGLYELGIKCPVCEKTGYE